VVKNIPKDRLLAETDTPFLAPLPFRGQINKPDYVRYVYQKIAELWGVDLAQAEATLDGNAKNLFNII
jgi:TatD DNase family protein